MKTLWICIGLITAITIMNLFFFKWIFGVGDFGLPLLFSLFAAIFLCLILFILEKDKRSFMAAGFSVVALWASIIVQARNEVPMPVLMNSAILFFAPLLIITAKEAMSGGMKFIPVLFSGVTESTLIFGVIQGIILMDRINISPFQFVFFFH